MVTQENQRLVLEMAYSTWCDSCRDPAAFGQDLRQCRRLKGHEGQYASGTTIGTLRTWGRP